MLLLSTRISLHSILAHSKAQMADIIILIQTRRCPLMRTYTTPLHRALFLTHFLRALAAKVQCRRFLLQLEPDINGMSKQVKDMFTEMIW
jgi:hypothetical protein